MVDEQKTAAVHERKVAMRPADLVWSPIAVGSVLLTVGHLIGLAAGTAAWWAAR